MSLIFRTLLCSDAMYVLWSRIQSTHIQFLDVVKLHWSSLTSDMTGIPQVIVTDWDSHPPMDG